MNENQINYNSFLAQNLTLRRNCKTRTVQINLKEDPSKSAEYSRKYKYIFLLTCFNKGRGSSRAMKLKMLP